MDTIDHKIISLLAEDSRRSLSDIGEHVSLSPSAVNERMRRLLASGAIKRFTVDADHAALGMDILAFVFVSLDARANEEAFRAYMNGHRAIAECHHITGAWSYLIKIRVGALTGIEEFLADLKVRGFLARSETVIALSTITETPFTPPEI